MNRSYSKSLEKQYEHACNWIHQRFGAVNFEIPGEADRQLEAYIQHVYDTTLAPTDRHKHFCRVREAILGVQHRHRALYGTLKESWEPITTWWLELPVQLRTPVSEEAATSFFLWGLVKALLLDVERAGDWFCFALGGGPLWRAGRVLPLSRYRRARLQAERPRSLLEPNPKTRRHFGRIQSAISDDLVMPKWLEWFTEEVGDLKLCLGGGPQTAL